MPLSVLCYFSCFAYFSFGREGSHPGMYTGWSSSSASQACEASVSLSQRVIEQVVDLRFHAFTWRPTDPYATSSFSSASWIFPLPPHHREVVIHNTEWQDVRLSHGRLSHIIIWLDHKIVDISKFVKWLAKNIKWVINISYIIFLI